MFEYGISAKWLELLREISPGVKRVAVLREPTVAGIGQLAAMQTAAPSFGVELQPIDARDVGEFERVLADFAAAANGGLIVPLSTSAETHRTSAVFAQRRKSAFRLVITALRGSPIEHHTGVQLIRQIRQ
jgi:hypothetical protein